MYMILKPQYRCFWDITTIHDDDHGERYPYLAFDVLVGPDESVSTILHGQTGEGMDLRDLELELDC